MEGPIPPEGTSVHGLLDWARLYALMRVHPTLHILCRVVWRDYEAHVTSSAMVLGQVRQDFELERLALDFVTEVERPVNAEIEVVRVCEIAGLDLQVDGGMHVARTGEVGSIRVVGHQSKGHINKRLHLAIEG